MTPAERLLEIAALRQNAIDYWFRVDHEGGAGVSEMFIEQGVFHAGPGDPLVGREAIEAFYAWRRERGTRTSRHIITNFHAPSTENARCARPASCCSTAPTEPRRTRAPARRWWPT